MSANKDDNLQAQDSTQGTSEQALRAARIAKADRIRARGDDPFANDIDDRLITPLGDVRARYASARTGEVDGTERYDGERVRELCALSSSDNTTVVGRVVAARSFGKARFLRIRDYTGAVQLFCRQNVLGSAFDRLEDIDVADHVQASGPIMVTKSGELSIDVASIRLLTKAYRPLPEKWHGLTDVEARYRHRYLDLITNSEVRSIFTARAAIVRALREYLDRSGFLEVETPTMGTLVGGATARPFTTHHNALDLDLYMRVAPELYLKRLVVGGLERVYELGRMYRNEGLSTRHNPEFTMLEFYRAYATYETLMCMTEEMLRHVDSELRRSMPKEHEEWSNRRQFRLDRPFVRKSMHDLLAFRLAPETRASNEANALLSRFADAGLTQASLGDVQQLAGVFERLRADPSIKLESSVRKQVVACENQGERIFLLYELLVEPSLPELFRSDDKSIPVFVMDHPVEVSPLARRQTRPGGDPGLVDRFELFVHGKELCNAFSELNDPQDQEERFRAQVAKKARGAQETMDYDEDYIRALEHGLPPTAGFGMGIDRLVMMLTAQDSIREVILFPLLRPEH